MGTSSELGIHLYSNSGPALHDRLDVRCRPNLCENASSNTITLSI